MAHPLFWRPQGFPQAAWEALGVLEDSPPHVVLGVPPKVSRRDVARAYKSLALRFHPDKTMDDTADVMKILSKARDRLLSTEKHDDKEPEKKEKRNQHDKDANWARPENDPKHEKDAYLNAEDSVKLQRLRVFLVEQKEVLYSDYLDVGGDWQLGDRIMTHLGATSSSKSRSRANARGAWRRVLSKFWYEVEHALDLQGRAAKKHKPK